MNDNSFTTVTIRVPTDLYLEYKIKLLEGQKNGLGRKNTSQDLLAHIRKVVDESQTIKK